MECCAIKNQAEWLRFNTEFSASGIQIPKSCCRKDDESGEVGSIFVYIAYPIYNLTHEMSVIHGTKNLMIWYQYYYNSYQQHY